jgi:hypothetical protein
MNRWQCIAKRVTGECVGAEVGVAEGKMSAMLLKTMPGLTLYMVDRWSEYSDEERKRDKYSKQPLLRQKDWDAKYSKAKSVSAIYNGRGRIVRESSLNAVAQFDDEFFDFVFLDADHSFEGAWADIAAWYPKVKVGGYLCGHDYHNKANPKPGVDKAVDEAFGDRVKSDDNATWFVKRV